MVKASTSPSDLPFATDLFSCLVRKNVFLIGLPLGMTLIGFGDVITAVCLPRQKSQRIDKDFDQNRNAKMVAKMLANFVQVPDFLTYASEIYDIGTKILLLQ